MTEQSPITSAPTTDPLAEPKYSYDAFLSYRSDTDYDRARKIEAFLESLHKTVARTSGKVRQLQICRDGSDFTLPRRQTQQATSLTTDLANDTDPIWQIIQSQLSQSQFLIVLCSPGAVASSYVSKEIRWFIEYRGKEWIIPVVTEGTDPRNKPEECFPVDILKSKLHESLIWYDFRKMNRANKQPRVRDYEDEIVRLAADLLGWDAEKNGPLLAIWQRERSKRRRRQSFLMLIAAALFLAVGAYAFVSAQQKGSALRELEKTLQKNGQLQNETQKALEQANKEVAERERIANERDRVLNERDEAQNARDEALKGEKIQAEKAIKAAQIAEQRRKEAEKQTRLANEAAYRGREGLGRLALLLTETPGASTEAVVRGVQGYYTDPGSNQRVPPEAMEGLSASLSNISDAFPLRGAGAGVGVAFSRDGKRVLTASADGMARLWDINSGETIRTFGEDIPAGIGGERLTSVGFSPDERFVYATSMVGTVQVWDIANGDRTARFGGNQGLLYSVAFSPKGNALVLGGYALEVGSPPRAYLASPKAPTNAARPLIGHIGAINAVDFSSDGSRVLTVSADGTGRIWSTDTAESIAILRGHSSAIISGMFSPDGEWILTASEDQTLRIWSSIKRGEISPERTYNLTFSPIAVSYSRDGSRLLILSGQNTCEIRRATDGQKLAAIDARPASGVFKKAVFSADGLLVSTINEDERVRIWSATTGQLLHTFDHIERGIESIAFSPIPGDTRLLIGRFLGPDQLLTFHGGNSLMTLRGSASSVLEAVRANPHSFLNADVVSQLDITSAAFSPDGRRIATGSMGGLLNIWTADTGQLLLTAVTKHNPKSITFSKDGQKVAAVLEEEFLVWDLQSGVTTSHLEDKDVRYSSVDFAPDGQSVVLGGTKLVENKAEAERKSDVPIAIAGMIPGPMIIEIRSVNTGALISRFEGLPPGTVKSVEFRYDGKAVVSASSDGSVSIWDVASRKALVSKILHGGTAWSARFSVDGGKIVSSGGDSKAIVCDAKTLNPLRSLDGHNNSVISARFSPNSEFVVTASWDGTVRVWNAQDGGLRGNFRMHRGVVWFADFSPDSSRLISVGGDGAVRLYPSEMRALFEIAGQTLRFQPEFETVRSYYRSKPIKLP